MKKRISIFVCLAFFSLACVMSAARIDVGGSELVKSAPASRVKAVATIQPRTCALVVAETAVTLRSLPSAESRSLDHLRAGVIVDLLDDASGQWWRVKSGEQVGFVRSLYLQEQECER